MGARFDVQDPRGTERLKAGVGVVGEGGPVEGAGGLHVVQQETKLIWVLALGLQLGLPQEDARALHSMAVSLITWHVCGDKGKQSST